MIRASSFHAVWEDLHSTTSQGIFGQGLTCLWVCDGAGRIWCGFSEPGVSLASGQGSLLAPSVAMSRGAGFGRLARLHEDPHVATPYSLGV